MNSLQNTPTLRKFVNYIPPEVDIAKGMPHFPSVDKVTPIEKRVSIDEKKSI